MLGVACGAACRGSTPGSARTAPAAAALHLSRNAVPGCGFSDVVRRSHSAATAVLREATKFFFFRRRRTLVRRTASSRPFDGGYAATKRRASSLEGTRARSIKCVGFDAGHSPSSGCAAAGLRAHAAAAASRAAPHRSGTMVGTTCLAGPHQPPAQHFDQQLPLPARDALAQPETLGWRGRPRRLAYLRETGAADGLGRRPIVGGSCHCEPRGALNYLRYGSRQRNAVACAVVALGLRAGPAGGSPATPEPAGQSSTCPLLTTRAEPDLVAAAGAHVHRQCTTSRTRCTGRARRGVESVCRHANEAADAGKRHARVGKARRSGFLEVGSLVSERRVWGRSSRRTSTWNRGCLRRGSWRCRGADQRVAARLRCSLPDGVHGLSVVLKSASTRPRFAPQTLQSDADGDGVAEFLRHRPG